VSVGIPAYNRPEGVSRTLECMTNQSHANLEVIVSDNCSPDGRVTEVLHEWSKKDRRISVYRQPANRGAFDNFRFLLKKASGEFFMWAADDDAWQPFFVKGLVELLMHEDSSTVAAIFEARYFTKWPRLLPFFPEGTEFYVFRSSSSSRRIEHMLRHNYGNLFYSLYRKTILDRFFPRLMDNEIPFFLQVSRFGNWRVLPQVGFFKQTTIETYREARWEKTGGFTAPRLLRIPALLATIEYHRRAESNSVSAIVSLQLSGGASSRLTRLCRRLLWRHLATVIMGIKGKRARKPQNA
jgi:glycosyltransferase involved in cell wall biosynthesis